jgi:hypothetical protein
MHSVYASRHSSCKCGCKPPGSMCTFCPTQATCIQHSTLKQSKLHQHPKQPRGHGQASATSHLWTQLLNSLPAACLPRRGCPATDIPSRTMGASSLHCKQNAYTLPLPADPAVCCPPSRSPPSPAQSHSHQQQASPAAFPAPQQPWPAPTATRQQLPPATAAWTLGW